MRIEDEIKQASFSSPFQKAVINIYFTASWLQYRGELVFKKYGLTAPQYNVLRILKGQHPRPICAGDVLSRMIDKSSNITRLVDKLLEKGLVDRKVNESNRRMQDLTITDKGLQLLESMRPEVEENNLSLQNLSEEEATQLSDLLDKIRG